MLQSKFSRAVVIKDEQRSDGNEGTPSASILKIWKSLDRKRKMKAGQIMTRPTIVPRSDNGGLIPAWALVELQRQKERDALCAVLNNVEPDGKDQASDLEVALYLMCGSLEGPITEQACRIYFNAASKISGSLKEAMKSSGIEVRPLDEYDSSQLVAFKRWIRKRQVGVKNMTKVFAFVRMLDGTIIELESFDLLWTERQI
jgi:hypothetical protein